MCCLTDFCFLCFKKNIKLQSVLVQDIDGIVVNEKLRCFFPEIIDSTPDEHKLACSYCLEKLRISYDFKQSVICNNSVFRDYIDKLQCQHKSPAAIPPFEADFTAIKVENFDEKYDGANMNIQNENLNLTSTNLEELSTHDQSCQFTTNENDAFFTKLSCQPKEINIKIENILDPLIEEIDIKQEPLVEEDSSSNYSDEESKEYEDTFECEFCDMGFSSPIYLDNHTCRFNKNTQKSERKVTQKIGDDTESNGFFKCLICDKIYTLKSLYDRHWLVKHCIYNKRQETNAENCQNRATKNTESISTFNNEYNLQPNRRGRPLKRLHKCNECQKTFPTPSVLKRHRRMHSGEKPYKCQICHKLFADPGNLKKHKLIHTGEKAYQCDVCNKTFNQKGHLTIHKRSHDNVRPYQCSECNRAFTQSCHLTTHMRTHTGETPFQCNICQFKCAQSGTLKYHVRTHTGETPYKCKHCQKTFSRSGNLNIHIRRKHS